MQTGSCAPSLHSPQQRCLTNCLGCLFLVGTAMLASLADPWETCCMSAHETASHHRVWAFCISSRDVVTVLPSVEPSMLLAFAFRGKNISTA